MYTSFVSSNAGKQSTSSSRGFRNRNVRQPAPTRDELVSGMHTAGLLKLSQRILGGKAVVKHVISDTAYIVYHEDFRQEFIVRQVPDEEDITKWIDLQTHSNIVTAFDSFREEISGAHFSMSENNNGGNIFQHIKKLNLNLAIDVPRSYIEMIYDVAIQLAQGIDFAHNAGLVHGQFDLSKVVLQTENENIIYKITDFAPNTSLQQPLSTEASYWPFSKQKKQISDREKMEVIMLKDIYTLGIAILELMIGRTSKQTFSISLDSLPLTWAEFPESTPLIQVLVECIQIDSITQRKGRLQGIKKLLIREYKKFFQKPIYKMEAPFVGKKADVFNKKGIVALFHDKEGEALHYWSEARILSDRHFDSQCNFCMHRWSTGRISDQQLLEELDEFVFSVPGKGETLHAYLLISMGEREQGMNILKKYIAGTEASMQGANRLQNLKQRRQLKQAQEVFNVVQLNKSQFFNNTKVKHEHQKRITCLQYSQNGAFIVSISPDLCKIWRIVNNLMGTHCVIPGNLDADTTEDTVNPVAAVSDNGGLVAIYRGKLHFQIYSIPQAEQYQKKDTVNLRREIIANGISTFNFTPQRDKVTRMKFIGDQEEPTVLRIFMLIDGNDQISDVQLSDHVANLNNQKRYFDAPIFNVPEDQMTPQMATRQENVRRLIEEQTQNNNELIFPSEDMRFVVVFNKEDAKQKHYRVYDNLRNEYIRKVAKRTMFDEAAAVVNTANVIAFIEDADISIRSIRMPNNATLIDNLRPRIAVAESKLNPAQACLNRQNYKDKLYRELHAYHMFKDNPLAEKTLGLTEEQNVQLMVLKYEEGALNPYKLKANRELMMLQKVLLRDAVRTTHMRDLQAQCPLIGVEGVKRIEIYDDELTFNSPESQIDDVMMSSEPHRNFFLIAMDKLVYKYDLVSKELLFQFHTNAKSINLYDKDDKLVVTSGNEIRLWDFYDHKEEAPELITAMQLDSEVDFQVENVFINKNSNCTALLLLVTYKYKFVVYSGRLEIKFQKELDSEDELITAGAFSKDSTVVIIGTSQGKIYSFKITDGSYDKQPYQAVGAETAITSLVTLNNIEDNDAYLMISGNNELMIYIHNKNETRDVDFGEDGQVFATHPIKKVQVAENNKFFMIGIPSRRAIGFFGLNRVQLTSKPLKWVTRYPFEDFYADDHLSTMMLIDERRRALDFQYILWRFDTSNLDQQTLKFLDNGPGAQTEDIEDLPEVDTLGNEVPRKPVDQIKGSSCCTIF